MLYLALRGQDIMGLSSSMTPVSSQAIVLDQHSTLVPRFLCRDRYASITQISIVVHLSRGQEDGESEYTPQSYPANCRS